MDDLVTTVELVVTRGIKGIDQPNRIGTFPILNQLNNKVWSSRMRLHLKGLELWNIIESKNPINKKDQVVSILFSTISEEITPELDVEKTMKDTWNIL